MPDMKVLLRSVLMTCSIVGAFSIAAVVVSKHGLIFAPLYAGAVWGAYYLQTFRRNHAE